MKDLPGFAFWFSRWPEVCLVTIGSVLILLIIRALVARVRP